jgi:hypothetical protein
MSLGRRSNSKVFTLFRCDLIVYLYENDEEGRKLIESTDKNIAHNIPRILINIKNGGAIRSDGHLTT